MKIVETSKVYIDKLRKMSDNKKKFVLWTIVIVLAVIMGFFWFKTTINRFSNLEGNFGNIQFPEIEIPEMQTQSNETENWKIYKNNEYGFEIEFPESWEGYSVVKDFWQGSEVNDNGNLKYGGPRIIFKNPQTTDQQLWQDIPIMVITPDVWEFIIEEKVSVSSAPIGPAKIGKNEKYIFATPPRWYGFTDAMGSDEAVEIVETFKTF